MISSFHSNKEENFQKIRWSVGTNLLKEQWGGGGGGARGRENPKMLGNAMRIFHFHFVTLSDNCD